MAKTSIRNDNLVEIVAKQLEGIRLLVSRIDKTASGKLVEMIVQADRIFVTGQGRSGLIAQCLATRLAQIGLDVYIPGHATCQKIEEDDLLIAISCRGTTRTTVEFARVSRNVGAKVASVTAFDTSTLSEHSNLIVLIPSNDKGIREACKYIVGPENNTLFEQATLLYFDALIYVLMERKGIPEGIINQRHTNLE